MKRIISIVIAITFIFASAMPVFATDVKINGKQVLYTKESGQPFIDSASKTQVPFRATMESFGASVRWDSQNQTAIAEKDGITVEVPIGQKYIYKNKEMIANDTSAIIKDNRTYLPIRAVLEAFGASVRWEETSQTVVISDKKDDFLYVHFLDVGQADCIFIDHGDFEVLIDGGCKETSQKVIDEMKPYVDGNLDLVIATHEHQDHIGGLPAILNAFQVSQIIDNGRAYTTSYYEEYMAAVQAEPNCKYSIMKDGVIDLGNQAFLKLIPMAGTYETPNENCIVSSLEYHNIKVLFMADLETNVERNNLDKFSHVNVLKVGHHGSRTATSKEFLSLVKPEVSIISAGIDNEFWLPNVNVLTRLLADGSTVYGTFRSGNIVLSTDGNTYQFNTNTNLTSDDAKALSFPVHNTNETELENNAAYVGNMSTLKFHTLTCPAGEKIADRKVIYFKTREEAVNGLFQPCKICNP